MTEQQKRPPLGLRRESIYVEITNRERIEEILAAIGRYADDQGKEIPDEWLQELHRRLKQKQKFEGLAEPTTPQIVSLDDPENCRNKRDT